MKKEEAKVIIEYCVCEMIQSGNEDWAEKLNKVNKEYINIDEDKTLSKMETIEAINALTKVMNLDSAHISTDEERKVSIKIMELVNSL